MEKYPRARSAPFTFLRPNSLMQHLSTTYRDDIRVRGEICAPAAFVDTDDVGRVAARVLTEAGHIGRAYTLAGAHSVGYYAVSRSENRRSLVTRSRAQRRRWARTSSSECSVAGYVGLAFHLGIAGLDEILKVTALVARPPFSTLPSLYFRY